MQAGAFTKTIIVWDHCRVIIVHSLLGTLAVGVALKLNLDETIPMATFNGNSSNLGNSILKKSSKYTRAQSAMPRNRQKAPTAEEMLKFNGANPNNNMQQQSLRKSASASALKRPYSASPISQNHLKEALEFAGSVRNLQSASRTLTAKLRSRGRPKTAMMLSGLSLRTQHRDVRAKHGLNTARAGNNFETIVIDH